MNSPGELLAIRTDELHDRCLIAVSGEVDRATALFEVTGTETLLPFVDAP
jgi:hypothetical protein